MYEESKSNLGSNLQHIVGKEKEITVQLTTSSWVAPSTLMPLT